MNIFSPITGTEYLTKPLPSVKGVPLRCHVAHIVLAVVEVGRGLQFHLSVPLDESITCTCVPGEGNETGVDDHIEWRLGYRICISHLGRIVEIDELTTPDCSSAASALGSMLRR